MSKEFSYMLELLNATINKKEPALPKYALNFNEFVKISQQHMVASIIYPTIVKIAPLLDISEELLAKLKSYTLQTGITQMRKKAYLLDVLKAFNKHDVPAILLKGPIISELYPVPSSRISVDSDIFIKTADEERVRSILTKELSYTAETNPSEVYVLTYHFADYHIEVHSSLWEDDQGERYNRLTSIGIDSFESTKIREINGVPTRVMNTTNTFVYLFYHMVKHFMIKGIGIRYLIDITLFVSHYHEEIDYDIFWESMDTLGYRWFCIEFFMLCHEFFSLDLALIEGLNDSDKRKEININLILDIEEGGHNGCATAVRDGATGILWNCYVEQNLNIETKLNAFSFIKLFINKCQSRRPENKTNTVYSKYIVIRGIQYCFYLISTRKQRKKEKGEFNESFSVAKKRIELMKNLNLYFK